MEHGSSKSEAVWFSNMSLNTWLADNSGNKDGTKINKIDWQIVFGIFIWKI